MYRIVPLSLSRVDVHIRPHRLYTLGILWGISRTIPFSPIIITNTLCTCAMLHIALWLSLLGFPLVVENLHDTVKTKCGSNSIGKGFHLNDSSLNTKWQWCFWCVREIIIFLPLWCCAKWFFVILGMWLDQYNFSSFSTIVRRLLKRWSGQRWQV